MRRIADLPSQISVGLRCPCVTQSVVPVQWLVNRFGPDGTVEEAERRLICKRCGQRPELTFEWNWGTRLSIANGSKAPPLPAWLQIEGAT